MLQGGDVAGPINTGRRSVHKIEAYPALDWLRMALASMVALGHFGVVFPKPFGGHFAVEIFLALSGWLIGGILIRSGKRDLPRFFFNRSTRIWFPYLAAIVLLYGFALLREGASLDWLKYLFYDLTFTHYNFVTFPRALAEMPLGGSGNQFWSLAVEEQFYLAAPIFMFALPFGKRLMPWVVIAAIAMACESIAAPLTLGVCSAILQRNHGDWHLTRWGQPAVIAVTIALGVAAHWWDLPQVRSLFATGIVLSLAFPGRRSVLGLFLGGVSYPFYLNHWIGRFVAHGIYKHAKLSFPIYVALAFGISFAVSAIAWMLIDRSVMHRRNSWFSEAWGTRAAVAAYVNVLLGLAGGIIIYRLGG